MLNVSSTIVLILLFVGLSLLERFLAQKGNKWLGFIIPAICFVIALIIGIGHIVIDLHADFAILLMDIVFVIIYNIPTFIFLIIYYFSRKKNNKRKELEKMNIQDLK
jgi:predicted permease